MTVEDIQKICTCFPHVTEDMKWRADLCWSIGGKMFAVAGPDALPVTLSFKTGDEDFAVLSEAAGCKPPPYLARHKWIYTDDINRFTRKHWQQYLAEAYRLVAQKLPAKMKKQLNIQ